jgi:hypothetical protein
VLGNKYDLSVGEVGQPITRILRGDTMLCQIEHFVDDDPRKPHAYAQYMDRWNSIKDDVNLHGKYGLVLLDSTSFLETASTWHNQYLKYPHPDNERKYGWNSFVTRDLREVLHGQLTSLTCHVGVAVHIHISPDEGIEGMAKNPHVPGQLRPHLAGAYNAVVRIYEEGGQRVLQTSMRDGYACGTSAMIDAPDPCAPTFESFISNIIRKQRKEQTSASE